MRRLPSNVEKADLIQVGLIAVAQAAMGFKYEGDPNSEAAKEAFVRYARMRVKGAMLDELRQMDMLGRAQRRKVKAVEIARERWRSLHGSDPTLTELGELCGMETDEIASLDHAAALAQVESFATEGDEGFGSATQPSTAQDEIEARVDTAIVMRRLEKFFAALPERDRQVIDSYLGIGMSPVELAATLQVSVSRVSQLYKAVRSRFERHFGMGDQSTTARQADEVQVPFNDLVEAREAQIASSPEAGAWSALIEETLTMPSERFGGDRDDDVVQIASDTRWG